MTNLSQQKTSQVAIALGSNLGDSRQTLETAITLLDQTPGIQVKLRSHWYVTAPIGPPQPDYLNGCALLDVTLTPQDLLENLLTLEAKFGRVRREKWQARTLDLDIILFNDQIVDEPDLKIPHPWMRERAFVLVPLAEIAPEWIDPVTGNAIATLVKLIDISGVHLL